MILNLAKRKFKVYIFWIVYWFIQSVLMSGGKEVHFYLVKNIVLVGLQICVVYLNLKVLFPLFFTKKKYLVYSILSFLLIYTAFTISFGLIDVLFGFVYSGFKGMLEVRFATDFWEILSGSSFYSLGLVCSLVYQLIKLNNEKDSAHLELKQNIIKNSKDKIITIKEGYQTHKIAIDDVYYIKGLKEYVVWHTKSRNVIALQTMRSIEENYKELGFLRVHKSYILNREHIDTIQTNSIFVNGEQIPIGRAYKSNLMDI